MKSNPKPKGQNTFNYLVEWKKMTWHGRFHLFLHLLGRHDYEGLSFCLICLEEK